VCCFTPLVVSRLHSSRYLAAVAGRCLNCLSSSHRREDCHLPTHCFNCHGLRYHLRDCKLPRKSLVALGDSEASHVTLPSLGDKDSSSALESSPSNASSFSEPDHIFFVPDHIFSCLWFAPSHAHGIPWLKRRHWEHWLVQHDVVAWRK
jgi:hypothetical protein